MVEAFAEVFQHGTETFEIHNLTVCIGRTGQRYPRPKRMPVHARSGDPPRTVRGVCGIKQNFAC